MQYVVRIMQSGQCASSGHGSRIYVNNECYIFLLRVHFITVKMASSKEFLGRNIEFENLDEESDISSDDGEFLPPKKKIARWFFFRECI